MEVCDIELTEQMLGSCTAAIIFPSKTELKDKSQSVKRKKSSKYSCTGDDSLVNFIDLLEGKSNKLSVAKRKEDLFAKLKPPKCFLCADFNFHNVNRQKLLKHFIQCHMNHAVKFPHVTSVICKLNCDGYNQGHYHCPKPNCEVYLYKKERLVAHHLKHYEAQDRDKKTVAIPKKKPSKVFPPPMKV